VTAAPVVPADAVEVIHLWPDGPTTRIDGVGDEVTYPAPPGLAIGTTFLRNISDPTLTVFEPRADRANGVGVIVVPGGGWTINAWTHEGLEVAQWDEIKAAVSQHAELFRDGRVWQRIAPHAEPAPVLWRKRCNFP